MAFDGSGAEETNSSGLNARLWPNGIVPYVYDGDLSKCVCFFTCIKLDVLTCCAWGWYVLVIPLFPQLIIP